MTITYQTVSIVNKNSSTFKTTTYLCTRGSQDKYEYYVTMTALNFWVKNGSRWSISFLCFSHLLKRLWIGRICESHLWEVYNILREDQWMIKTKNFFFFNFGKNVKIPHRLNTYMHMIKGFLRYEFHLLKITFEISNKNSKILKLK